MSIQVAVKRILRLESLGKSNQFFNDLFIRICVKIIELSAVEKRLNRMNIRGWQDFCTLDDSIAEHRL